MTAPHRARAPSVAAGALLPALTLGIVWKRATAWGAVTGMTAGLGVTIYYMATTHPWMRELFGVETPMADSLWWGIQPIAAGVFGVPVGFVVIVLVSLVTTPPRPEVQALVEHVRYPQVD